MRAPPADCCNSCYCRGESCRSPEAGWTRFVCPGPSWGPAAKAPGPARPRSAWPGAESWRGRVGLRFGWYRSALWRSESPPRPLCPQNFFRSIYAQALHWQTYLAANPGADPAEFDPVDEDPSLVCRCTCLAGSNREDLTIGRYVSRRQGPLCLPSPVSPGPQPQAPQSRHPAWAALSCRQAEAAMGPTCMRCRVPSDPVPFGEALALR